MKFIEVFATQCNSQGLTRGTSYPEKFFLNLDLVAAIKSDSLMLKGGDALIIGGNYYKDFRIVNSGDLEKLKV